jgi:hypothetical protein
VRQKCFRDLLLHADIARHDKGGRRAEALDDLGCTRGKSLDLLRSLDPRLLSTGAHVVQALIYP